jgi:hypothetical protein
MLPPMLCFATYSIYFYRGGSLTVADGFACLDIFFKLDVPLRWIPMFFGIFMEYTVSMKRIQTFLKLDEYNKNLIETTSGEHKIDSIDIHVEKGNFSWGKIQESKQIFKQINLKCWKFRLFSANLCSYLFNSS